MGLDEFGVLTKGVVPEQAYRQVIDPNSEEAKYRSQQKTKDRGKRQQAMYGERDADDW